MIAKSLYLAKLKCIVEYSLKIDCIAAQTKEKITNDA